MNVKKQQFAILWWKNPTYPKLTKTGQKQAMIYNPLAHGFWSAIIITYVCSLPV